MTRKKENQKVDVPKERIKGQYTPEIDDPKQEEPDSSMPSHRRPRPSQHTSRRTCEPLPSMTPPPRRGSSVHNNISTQASPRFDHRYADKLAKESSKSPSSSATHRTKIANTPTSTPGAYARASHRRSSTHDSSSKSSPRLVQKHTGKVAKSNAKSPAHSNTSGSSTPGAFAMSPMALDARTKRKNGKQVETATSNALWEYPALDAAEESWSSPTEVWEGDVEEPPAARMESSPGAVAVTSSSQQEHLQKGRLTILQEANIPQENPREFSTNNVTSCDDLEHGESNESHPVKEESFKVPKWYQNRFKQLVVILLLLIAIILAVTIPLTAKSSPSPSGARNVVDETSRKEVVETIVSLVSDPSVLAQTGSPQNRALAWIVQDEMSPLLNDDQLATSISTMLQRYALAVFFYATGGNDDEWIITSDWLRVDVDECIWQYVNCDSDGDVVSIDTGTDGNGVTGAIPPEIGLLSSMESMSLSRNTISSLPDEFASLTNLVRLYLNENDFNGTFPTVLYEISSLEVVDFGGNSFSGSISNEISKLSNLEILKLNFNSFSGPFPIESLASVQFLGIASNEFEGNLTDMLASLTQLVRLDVSRNNFVGSIPTEIGLLQRLEILNLERNDLLSSTIPSEIGLVVTLEELVLTSTGVTGKIPPEMSNLSNLEALVLSLNSLSGSVPTELCQLREPYGSLETFVVDCSVNCTCCSTCQ